MHAYRKPLGGVTVRSNRLSDFTKVGMVVATPAISLLPALDIQGYGIHFYRILLSVYVS